MAKNWIAGAVKNKGGLHRSLGIPEGKTIPKGMIAKAAQKGGKVGKQARLAQTLSGLGGGGKAKATGKKSKGPTKATSKKFGFE